MRAIILGSAAGGGFPQWNSAGPGCRRARMGDPAAKPRTQTSVAVSADGYRWVLLNAAPDLRAQIEATQALHPRPGAGSQRHSPIAAVVLTGAEIDTVAGLLTLRERHPFSLHGAAPALAALAENPIFRVLDAQLVPRRRLPLGQPEILADTQGQPLGLTVEAFAVAGKVPLSLLEGAACVLFDGTLWRDDEMIRAGVGTKTGQRMGHMSIDGAGGTMAAFARLGVRRRILIHLNNTNPVLLADSPEHAAVVAAGWEVAEDGMEIVL